MEIDCMCTAMHVGIDVESGNGYNVTTVRRQYDVTGYCFTSDKRVWRRKLQRNLQFWIATQIML